MFDLQSFLSFVPPAFRDRIMRPWAFNLDVLPLAAGGTATRSITIQNAAIFMLTDIVGRAFTGAAPQNSVADPPVTVTIRDSSGDNFESDAVPWSVWANSAGSPSPVGGFPIPRQVNAGATLTFTFVNLDPATAYNLRHGVKGVNIYDAVRGT